MTKAVIESVINEFLDSNRPEVLAISGKWGVGKTYALQKMVSAYKGKNSLAWYSYISAFGAKSIGDLRSMILVRTRPFPVKGIVLYISLSSATVGWNKRSSSNEMDRGL